MKASFGIGQICEKQAQRGLKHAHDIGLGDGDMKLYVALRDYTDTLDLKYFNNPDSRFACKHHRKSLRILLH